MPGPRKKRVRISPDHEVQGTIVPFQAAVENFNEYLLDDGTVVNMKAVVSEIVKLDDTWDDQGQPVYMINSTNVTSISVPDHLRRDS